MSENFRPCVEALEAREVPAAALVGGTLLVTPEGAGRQEVSFDRTPDQVTVFQNGRASSFAAAGVLRLAAVGAQQSSNVIQNNTNLPATLVGGAAADTLFSGTGGDTLLGGAGPDVFYSLLGKNRILARDGAADRVFSNPANKVDAEAGDRVTTFFDKGRVPGSGRLELDGGTLFITPTNAGGDVRIREEGRRLVVDFDLGDGRGQQTRTFELKKVRQIAFFGGSGSDTFVNDSSVDEAAYGAGADDFLLGGFGDFTLIKGSGGNDVAIGRGKRNDLSGNGGSDVLIALAGGDDNAIRADQADAVFGQGRRLPA